jgi:hypothetical protein
MRAKNATCNFFLSSCLDFTLPSPCSYIPSLSKQAEKKREFFACAPTDEPASQQTAPNLMSGEILRAHYTFFQLGAQKQTDKIA